MLSAWLQFWFLDFLKDEKLCQVTSVDNLSMWEKFGSFEIWKKIS